MTAATSEESKPPLRNTPNVVSMSLCRRTASRKIPSNEATHGCSFGRQLIPHFQYVRRVIPKGVRSTRSPGATL